MTHDKTEALGYCEEAHRVMVPFPSHHIKVHIREMNGALVAIWNYEVHLRMEWEPTNNRTVDS